MDKYIACPKNFIRAANCPSCKLCPVQIQCALTFLSTAKPYFLDDRTSFTANAGDTVRMECRVGGEVTDFKIFRDDLHQLGSDGTQLLKDPIENSTRVEFEYYSNLAVMVVKNIALTDEGSYTCQASNWHGLVSRSMALNVNNGK